VGGENIDAAGGENLDEVFLALQAARCRRLAWDICDDKMKRALLALADYYDLQANRAGSGATAGAVAGQEAAD
jgi:hypothetical protein